MKLSILTICYNSEAYIERAIESVLQQNYSDWEHIVVDGGSTDGTVEILKKYSHVKWISEPDQGQSDAMNKAFALATGDIIGYLNSDDFYSINAFSEVIKLFSCLESPDVVCGKLRILLGDREAFREPIDDYKSVSHFWLHKFPANPVSYFYKRKLQLKAGEFPIDNHQTMDYWFLLRAFRGAKLMKTETELGVFDLHADTKTYKRMAQESLNDDLLREYLNFSRELPLPDRLAYLYPWYRLKFDINFRDYFQKYKSRAGRLI
ncbi:glycosyltransferase involved in cell wall biosynthesis [Pontibacter ummariensis]|uniref:Glycosyltransferase involved in cell wall bisynthesis n=1 Tax=Pontibacter ummariensis TaxID=1610492 RepID=A0A239BLZ2_9BACT|nr:glycosyltransferase family 2 protein [Pontibacter ummariensis]PRY15772.1 glycosyltransferase involved in cell wall biosynthesis [Pontibacter ummariensis]SNS08639.1 Glycosyltransferase involved in cell wall bisynthesis [Pontibacter ummariensis]